MPAKGSTGTTRRKPLRSDRGVKLYGPTPAKPFFRVVVAGQVERTSAAVPIDAIPDAAAQGFDPAKIDRDVARARIESDEQFDRSVAWAKQQLRIAKRGERTIDALCDRRLQELKDKDRARGTYDKVDSLMRLYVRPQIGDVDVSEWTDRHCQKVLRAAKETCGTERIADLGKVLRSLVTLAHRKPSWLPRSEDPLEGVDYQVRARTQGEAVRFVPPSERPSTEQVDSLALAMQARGEGVERYLAARPNEPIHIDRGWGWLLPQVIGKCGCRLGETFALRASNLCAPRSQVVSLIHHDLSLNPLERARRLTDIVDLPHGYAIDPGRRVITVTETVEWSNSKPYIASAEIRASGKETKSKKDRWTIYPMSMLPAVVTRCRDLLERFGPERGPAALLFPEHDHVFVEVPVDQRRPFGAKRWQDQDWWNRSEFRKSMYLKSVAQAEFWPLRQPFALENLRHHFATWAKRNGYADELISHCMGHSTVSYTQQRYFRTGADTIPQGMVASQRL